ncbi:MAG: hypothetical protein ACHBN1_14385 [Heteroscytonema crispum UTEX LB 1556]
MNKVENSRLLYDRFRVVTINNTDKSDFPTAFQTQRNRRTRILLVSCQSTIKAKKCG